MNFTLLAIASAFFGAISNILARTLLKDLKSGDILGINFLTMGATLVLFSPLFYKFEANYFSMGLLVFIALIDTIGNYFYFKTFEKNEASVATPLLSLAPAVTFLTGWLFLKDDAPLQSYFIAVAIILLILIFSADFKNLKNFKKDTLIPALLASLLLGISAIPAKFLLNSEAINAPTLYTFRAGFIALFSLLFFQFQIKAITTKQYRIIFGRGLLVIAQWLLLYYALSLGNAGVTVTLANITPIFVFILGSLFLHEKMTLKKIITAVLILGLSFII